MHTEEVREAKRVESQNENWREPIPSEEREIKNKAKSEIKQRKREQ